MKNQEQYMRPVHAFIIFKTQEAYERCLVYYKTSHSCKDIIYNNFKE